VNPVVVPADLSLSPEELAGQLVQLATRLTVMETEHRVIVVSKDAEIAALKAEVAELKRRLGMNSQNSSKPPSTDSPFDKPAPKSLRGKSGRKRGGQQGHPGSTLAMADIADDTIAHEPGPCDRCGRDVSGGVLVGTTRRQVFDLPVLKLHVTEHVMYTRRCECGCETTGSAPAYVTAPVRYGPRITAVGGYPNAAQFLSRDRTAQALDELFGAPVSPATVSAFTARLAGGLGEFTTVVTKAIAAAPVAGFDETGFRVDSRPRWVHCARTGKYTLITVHDKRGVEGMKAAGVLPGFTGIAVHDAWAPYDTWTRVTHQLCCAHAERELAAVTEQLGPDLEWRWSEQAFDALVALGHLAAAGTRDGDEVDGHIHKLRSATRIGMAATDGRTGKIGKKHHALARRLLTRQDDYLRFLTNEAVPPDNNGSERDIRMIKLRQKVSGCMRTLKGAEQFCAIRGYLSTARKHGLRHLDVLVRLAEGNAWLPA
jgi:hypothetical protein